MTTRRYNAEEMQQVFEDPSYVRLYGKLLDKFGDNGIVSVVIGRQEGDTLHMALWLMSCRVLKRDMEFAMMDRARRGLCRAGDPYDPGLLLSYGEKRYGTGSVRAVRLYAGFRGCGGNRVWELPVEAYQKKNFVIQVETEA